MEKLDTPRTTRRHGSAVERKNFSSDEQKARSKRLTKSAHEAPKHSTPVNSVTPSETISDVSKILKSKSSSSDEVKGPRKARAKVRFGAKGLKSTKTIEYSDDDDVWETEEEHEERPEERRSLWEDERDERDKEFNKALQKPEQESEEEFLYKPKKSREKTLKYGENYSFHSISEDKLNELFRNEESRLLRSPEKVRREAVREDRVFQSPVKIPHLSLRKAYRETDDDLVPSELKLLPPLNIHEEDEEDFRTEKEIITKTYPKKHIQRNVALCEANYSFPVFRPTDSNDFLWEEFIRENEDDINKRVHELWSKGEERKRLLNNLLKPAPRKKFFVSKNKPASPSANVSKAKKPTKRRTEENTALSPNALNVRKMYDRGSSSLVEIIDIEEKQPKARGQTSVGKRREMRGRRIKGMPDEIRREILDCDKEAKECDKEIRSYEDVMLNTGYKEYPWRSGHSFQDWGDVMKSYARPKKSTREAVLKEIFDEWSDEEAGGFTKNIKNALEASREENAAVRSHEDQSDQGKDLVKFSSIPANSGEGGMERLELSSRVGKVLKKTSSRFLNAVQENNERTKRIRESRGDTSSGSSPAFNYSSMFLRSRQLEELKPSRQIRKARGNISKTPAPSFSYLSERNETFALSSTINKENPKRIRGNRGDKSSSCSSISHYSPMFFHSSQLRESEPPRKIRKIQENILTTPVPSFSYHSKRSETLALRSTINKENEEEKTEKSSPIFAFSLTRSDDRKTEESEHRFTRKNRKVSRKVEKTDSVYPQVNANLTPKRKREEEQEMSSPIFSYKSRRTKKSVTFVNKDATRKSKPRIKSNISLETRVKII